MNKTLTRGIATAMILISAISMSGCGNSTSYNSSSGSSNISNSSVRNYTLEEITTVSVTGKNGSGSVYAYFDPGDKASGMVNSSSGLDGTQLLYALKSSIDYSYEPSFGFNNGDKIKITATYDSSIADKLGISISPLEFTYEVSELQ